MGQKWTTGARLNGHLTAIDCKHVASDCFGKHTNRELRVWVAFVACTICRGRECTAAESDGAGAGIASEDGRRRVLARWRRDSRARAAEDDG